MFNQFNDPEVEFPVEPKPTPSSASDEGFVDGMDGEIAALARVSAEETMAPTRWGWV